jgi:cytochrome c oxidase subunit 3
MARTSEHVEVERKPKLGGGGPGKIPHRRGYGGGDDGDHGQPDDFVSRKDRMGRYRIVMAIVIIVLTAFFIGLTGAFIIRQGMGPYNSELKKAVPDWRPLVLPYSRLLINSAILLLSSLTLEFARRGLRRKAEFAAMGILPPKLKSELPWLSITVALGFAFLVGQVMVWDILRHQGLYVSSNPSSKYFYVLTGAHAVHLVGGLLVLLWALLASYSKHRFESRLIAVDVTGWYWHYMGILWIYIFALLHFARG